MKTDSISVKFYAAKARALAFYMAKKETGIDAEIADFLDKLYEKFVPKDARDLIQWQSELDDKSAKRPPAKKAGDVG